MWTKSIVLSFLLLISTAYFLPIEGAVSNNQLNISVAKTSYQNMGNNCYDAQVLLSLNNTSINSVFINIRQIILIESGTNITIHNNFNYAYPNNTIQVLEVFPNTPINIYITYHSFCLIITSNIIIYVIYDSTTLPLKVKLFP